MARDYTLVENFKKWDKYVVVWGSGFKAGLKLTPTLLIS